MPTVWTREMPESAERGWYYNLQNGREKLREGIA